MTSVLFVCLGNICRSPTADAVFRKKVADAGLSGRILVDSVGTGGWHVGKPPDARATATAMKRGYDLSSLRARQIHTSDFEKFDYILAMDVSNLADIREICPQAHHSKLQLLLEFAPSCNLNEVPDPYYGSVSGFDDVLSVIEQAAEGLLEHIKRNLAR